MTISFSGGVQLSQGVNLAVTEYDPSFLYLLGGTGAWYDPSDLTTMYQDSSGTTPVTAAGQSVGLILDKSKGLVIGPELVTNGTFDTDTSWTKDAGWTITGGAAVATSVTGYAGIYQNIGIAAGRTYRVTVSVTVTSGTVGIGLGNSGENIWLTTSASGTYSQLVTTSTLTLGTNVYARGNSAFTGTVDSISVKLVPGNHAAQSATSQRPILGRNPITGTRNRLTYTEQFDNAAWAKNNSSVVANAAMAPDGTFTADKLIPNTAMNTHSLDRAITGIYSSGGTVMFSVRVKADPYAFVGVAIYDQPSYSGEVRATFNLTNLTSSTSILGTGVTEVAASITDIGNDWRLLTVTGKFAAGTGVYPSIIVNPTNSNVFGIGSAGDGVGGTLVWGAQLETGSTATAYQKVVSQYDVTETGVTDAYYLAFDGSDDWMITNTITPGIDKAQVFAGVRKLSDAARGILVELGSAPASNAINVSAPGGASATYSIGGGGSLFVGPISTSASYSAPITNVLAVTDDIAADNGSLRVNGGAAQQLLTTDQGTGNFAANPLYLGRRGGTTLPFNGRIYALIVRFGGNLDSTIISDTETWVNSKTGAY